MSVDLQAARAAVTQLEVTQPFGQPDIVVIKVADLQKLCNTVESLCAEVERLRGPIDTHTAVPLKPSKFSFLP